MSQEKVTFGRCHCHVTHVTQPQGGKAGMLKRLGMVICAASMMMAQSASAQAADRALKRQAREALELFYLDRGIYDPVQCEVEDGGEPERTWTFCSAVGGDGSIGGLYMVAPSEGNAGIIYAINGKAIQHIGDGAIKIGDVRQNGVAVMRWPGKPIKIESILGIFD